MRFTVMVLMLFGICGLFGCLSEENLKKAEALGEENAALALEVEGLAAKAKAGTLSSVDAVAAIGKLTAQMNKNLALMKELKSSGDGTAGMLGGLAVMLGRSALHAVAAVQTGNPLLVAIQGLLTLLLGGSSTKKVAAAPTLPAS